MAPYNILTYSFFRRAAIPSKVTYLKDEINMFSRWKQHHWKHLLQPLYPQKWHLPKGSPNISQFFPRCMGNKSTQTKESNWMSVASHEWFSPTEKKSMKILMKVCSWFLLQVNQNPYPTINIYQFWDTLWDKAPYSSSDFGFRQYQSIHVVLLVSHGCRKCQKLRFRSGQGVKVQWLAKLWIVSFETVNSGGVSDLQQFSMKSCTTCGMKP